jgi:hypothetical protein
MRIGKGIVGITNEGLVFVERPISEKKARKVALRTVGWYAGIVPVGKIKALFVDNPIYPQGCSPDYGSNQYETCEHCVLDDDICVVKKQVQMSDGSVADVASVAGYKACKSWVCWVYAKFLNKYGWVNDRCIETHDNAILDRGNEGQRPDLLLFAGSEDGSLGLFIPGLTRSTLPSPPFKIQIQSTNYWTQDGKPQIVNWETVVNGTGLFLIWFGDYILPFRAYYSYPAATRVLPGFSGSNAYIVQ